MPVHKYNLGLIGNCSYLALVDLTADVKWMCLPRFDSSFLFGSLLDEKMGGHFWIRPHGDSHSSKQYYIPNTNVLCTEFTCAEGSFVVEDCAPRMVVYERKFRPLMLVRKIRLLSGAPNVQVTCRPRGDYGKLTPESVVASNHIRFLNLEQQVRLTTDIPLNYILKEQPFVLDQNKYLVLAYGEPLEAPLQETADAFLKKTILYWQNWIKSSYLPDIYQDEIIRSMLVLKLHQFEDTGGIIASGSTSLPEFHDSTRNWDYRFCWFRDSYYTLRAFNQVGHFEELEKYFDFIGNIIRNSKDGLQPVYSITGDKDLFERTLDLEGYLGNKPVRVGNKAYVQKQNDVYGQVLVSLLPLYVDKRLVFSRRTNYKQLVPWLLDQIERTLMEPDAGLWELRTEVKVHTYTLLFHWAGAKAAYLIADRFGDRELARKAKRLTRTASKNLELTYDPKRKLFTQAIDDPNVDASTLALITMDYLDHDSARAKHHVEGLVKELGTPEGLFYRYKCADDFGNPVSTFLICAFWYIDALACIDNTKEAIRRLDQVLKFSNHLGIFSEDVSLDGSQWGNFPQTYSHVGLINAVMRIARKSDKADFL